MSTRPEIAPESAQATLELAAMRRRIVLRAVIMPVLFFLVFLIVGVVFGRIFGFNQVDISSAVIGALVFTAFDAWAGIRAYGRDSRRAHLID
jgi:hypothetical protein